MLALLLLALLGEPRDDLGRAAPVVKTFADAERQTPLVLARWTTGGPEAGAVFGVAADPGRAGTIYATTFDSRVRIFTSADNGHTWTEITENYPLDPIPARLTVDGSGSGDLYVWHGACFGSLCYCCSGDVRARSAAGHGWDVLLAVDASISFVSSDPRPPAALYATLSTLIPPPRMGSDESVTRSLDGGRSWRVMGGLRAPLAILPDPTQPFRLYAIDAQTGFAVSADRGETWMAANEGLTDRFVTTAAVDPLLGNVVYAATPSGMFRTDSGGDSWERTSLGETATAVAFDAEIPGVVYAGTAGGVFRTSDGGITWRPINAGLPDLGILAMTIDPEAGFLHVGTASGVFDLDLRARSTRVLEPR